MTDAIKDLVKIKVIGVGGGGGNAINDMLYILFPYLLKISQ